MTDLNRLLTISTALLLLALAISVARAEHEADHRYVVEGYVLTDEEEPRPDVQVVVTGEQGLLGETETDHRGFYRVRLHLHNEDLGKVLTVKAGEQETRIEVTFDPADRETDRVHDLNFVGGGASEADLGTRGIPTWGYVLAGLVILAVGARFVSRELKRRRKREARARQKKKAHKKRRGKKKTGKSQRKGRK